MADGTTRTPADEPARLPNDLPNEEVAGADPAKPSQDESAVVDARTAQITTAIYGGIDEWDVRLTVFTAKDQITPERLREILPELLKGGICVGVEVRRAQRVE